MITCSWAHTIQKGKVLSGGTTEKITNPKKKDTKHDQLIADKENVYTCLNCTKSRCKGYCELVKK